MFRAVRYVTLAFVVTLSIPQLSRLYSQSYPFTDEAQTALFKDPVRTALYTPPTTVIKTNQLMTYKAKAAVCSEIRTKHSKQSEHHVEFLSVKPGGT